MKKILVVLMSALCLSGLSCGKFGDIPGLVELKGRVIYKGTPVDGATITFSPTSPSESTRSAVSMTESDGTFILMTQTYRGILPGDYRVSVIKKSPPPKSYSSEEIDAYMAQHGGKGPPVARVEIRDLVPAKYGNAETSGLSYSIKKGMPLLAIELTD